MVRAYDELLTELMNPIHSIEKLDRMMGSYGRMAPLMNKWEGHVVTMIEEKRKRLMHLRSSSDNDEELFAQAKDILDALVLSNMGEVFTLFTETVSLLRD